MEGRGPPFPQMRQKRNARITLQRPVLFFREVSSGIMQAGPLVESLECSYLIRKRAINKGQSYDLFIVLARLGSLAPREGLGGKSNDVQFYFCMLDIFFTAASNLMSSISDCRYGGTNELS